MARILGLEECNHSLRSALLSTLRVCDEVTVLPQAHRSEETGAFKNVVMRLNGQEEELNPDSFSPGWFNGVSMVQVAREIAEPLLSDAEKKKEALDKLVEAIPSELADSQLTVGPQLSCDKHDRDTESWTPGFDSPSCCVGLYSARMSRAPEAGLTGMNRAHLAYFLVCKAGGGVAAQTFASRLQTSLRKGLSLDQALESGDEPGPQALRRVSLAARRNRQRLLLIAAQALGLDASLDTIGDNAAAEEAIHRVVIPTLDVTYNSIRKEEGSSATKSTWLYASGCVDSTVSQGLMTSSNVAEGFVAFTDVNDSFKINLRNEAQNCLPFSTVRFETNRNIAIEIAEAHKKAIAKDMKAHPDHEWVTSRFGWKSKDVGKIGSAKIEPPNLWGSHHCESFLSTWAREIGISQLKSVRLSPEIVCVSGMEQAKLRAAVKHVTS